MLIEGLVGIVALIAATAMFPGDYFAINTLAGGLRRRSACRWSTCRQLESAVGETRRRPARRRGVAGGRHRADLQRPARHARPDGLLVSLRDHVRGAVHPHHHRHRHPRRALPGAGVPRPVLRADGPAGVDARIGGLDRCSWSCAWALLHLDRQHQHDLADVRHRQPAARRRSRSRSARRSSSTAARRATRGSRCCRSRSWR